MSGAGPDGVVVQDGVVYWTTMGFPSDDPAAGEANLDFSARNGGLHAVGLDGTGAREVVSAGSITTGKQLAADGAATLYWADREGCRIGRSVSASLSTPPRGCCTGRRRERPKAGRGGSWAPASRSPPGRPPQILADEFDEAIGLAVDGKADIAFVSDLGGRIHAVPLPAGPGGHPRVLAALEEPISGIASIRE